jgi:hypothetical protein
MPNCIGPELIGRFCQDDLQAAARQLDGAPSSTFSMGSSRELRVPGVVPLGRPGPTCSAQRAPRPAIRARTLRCLANNQGLFVLEVLRAHGHARCR